MLWTVGCVDCSVEMEDSWVEVEGIPIILLLAGGGLPRGGRPDTSSLASLPRLGRFSALCVSGLWLSVTGKQGEMPESDSQCLSAAAEE